MQLFESASYVCNRLEWTDVFGPLEAVKQHPSWSRRAVTPSPGCLDFPEIHEYS